MSVSPTDAMNDVLERCSDLGFEMKPGFSTHWSMGSETLIALGHPEIATDWALQFRTRLRHWDRPVPTKAIDAADEADWRSALCDWDRVSDWQALFDRELTEEPWQDVIARWWPRLIPGAGAGLTHGLIRTMHAVRSIDRAALAEPTPLQLHELATALAYWAGKYVEQPAARELRGPRQMREAIAAVPRMDFGRKIGLRDKGHFEQIHDIDGWGAAVEQLAEPLDVQEAFSDLTLAFAQVHLAHPEDFPIPMVHTMTAPAAARQMLAHLPQEQHLPTFVALWHSSAALLSSFAAAKPEETAAAAPDGEQPTVTREQLVERAVEHADMHVLKLTDACLREHARRPDPRYLLVCERLMQKMPPFFRGGHARAKAA